jgi:membrane protease YdiL (CAAX protease family)
MKISAAQVVLWTFGVRLVLEIAVLFALGLSPRFKDDLVMQTAVLSLVNLGACAFFAGRRPGRSWSETFALRRTSAWLVVLALSLGIAATLPTWELATWIDRFAPMSEVDKAAYDALITPRSFVHGVALFVFAAGVGPLSEELLFRGALYTGLRPQHSAAYAGLATGLLFTVSHHELRFWPSILALSGILALVRAVSGSLWPCFFLHAAYNASGVAMPLFAPSLNHPGVALVVGCSAASAALVGLVVWVGRRSAAADRARHVDLEPDPGLGEAES